MPSTAEPAAAELVYEFIQFENRWVKVEPGERCICVSFKDDAGRCRSYWNPEHPFRSWARRNPHLLMNTGWHMFASAASANEIQVTLTRGEDRHVLTLVVTHKTKKRRAVRVCWE